MATLRALATLEELRKYVHETLCEHDALELYAVWAGDEDRILFYDSTELEVHALAFAPAGGL